MCINVTIFLMSKPRQGRINIRGPLSDYKLRVNHRYIAVCNDSLHYFDLFLLFVLIVLRIKIVNILINLKILYCIEELYRSKQFRKMEL